MARVVAGSHRGALDPLKLSAPLGGALVILGLARSIPVLHGSQGCSAFAKALLTRHFREPIPLQTTAVTEVSAVLGPAQNLRTALDTITGTLAPDVIGVLTTGLVEASGEDLDGALDDYRRRSGTAGAAGGGRQPSGPVPSGPVPSRPVVSAAPLIVAARTPDFVGGLSEGWAATLTALVTQVASSPAAPMAPTADARPGASATSGASMTSGDPARSGDRRTPDGDPVPVLTGVSQTAGDLDEIASLVAGFGVRPVLVPDLSGSLDGHLAAGWTPLTTGGATLADLQLLREAPVVPAVAATAAPAAAALAELTGADVLTRPHLAGLDAVDAFVADLMQLTGRAPGRHVRRWRARFTDTMLDSQFVLGGVRVAIAAEAEDLAAVAALLAGVGAEVVAAVAPTRHALLADLPCAEVVVGDLVDLRERAAEAGAELVIGTGHAAAVAGELGAAYLPRGIPVPDRFGAGLRATAGYRGGTHFLIDVADRVLDHRARHPHPGPSRRSPPAARPAVAGSAVAGSTATRVTPERPIPEEEETTC